MIELVMIQLFGLLLGEPVYTFAIVLTSILLFTGFGAYLSGRYAMQAKRLIQTSVFLLACLLLTYSFFLTPVLRYAIGLPMWGRIVLTISLILPLGILLGIPFPSGIQIVNKQEPSFISWAWGINGFFTVIGSVVSLILSMMIGFQAVLWLAIVIYLLSMISIRNTNLKI
jgi:MFS family permease